MSARARRSTSTGPSSGNDDTVSTATKASDGHAGLSGASGRGSDARRVAPLDGLRVVLAVWMIIWHSYWWMSYFLTDEQFDTFGRDSGIAVFLNGYMAVDFFFILSGFVVSLPMIHAHNAALAGGATEAQAARAAVPSLPDAFFRRIARLWPSIFLVGALWCKVLFPSGLFPMTMLRSERTIGLLAAGNMTAANTEQFPTGCEAFPMNALFLNNLAPFGGCVGYTWSLAVQVQFYLLLPVLWRLAGDVRRLMAWLSVGVLLSLGARVANALFLLWLPSDTPQHAFFFWWFSWYTNFWCRIGVLFMGTLLAYVHTSTDCAATLRRHPGLVSGMWAVIAASMAGGFAWRAMEWDHMPAWAVVGHTALFQPGGIALGLAVAFMVFLMLNGVGTVGRAMRDSLGDPRWATPAKWTFQSYLLHPPILQKLYVSWLAPVRAEALAVAQYSVVALALSFGGAFAVYELYEAPVDRWLRGWMAAGRRRSAKAGDGAARSPPGVLLSLVSWLVFALGCVVVVVGPLAGITGGVVAFSTLK